MFGKTDLSTLVLIIVINVVFTFMRTHAKRTLETTHITYIFECLLAVGKAFVTTITVLVVYHIFQSGLH